MGLPFIYVPLDVEEFIVQVLRQADLLSSR